MDFRGPARRLSPDDVSIIAGYLGCEIAAVRAVLAVESAGKGFGPDGRPIILNEPHVFWRELPEGLRERAGAEGLAYPKWRTKPYPKTQAERYVWIERAMKIDETAALRSCSWGLGQMMGFNHAACGFATVKSFVRAMMVSEGAQLYAMARFIVSKGLQQYLHAMDWASFARGYNGTGYKANKYDVKLAQAYARRPAAEKITPPPSTEAQLKGFVGAAGSTAKNVTTGTIATGTIVGGIAASKRPEAEGGGFDWGLMIPIFVVGLSVAIVAWFVWPKGKPA